MEENDDKPINEFAAEVFVSVIADGFCVSVSALLSTSGKCKQFLDLVLSR